MARFFISPCKVYGCARNGKWGGYCPMHKKQLNRNGIAKNINIKFAYLECKNNEKTLYWNIISRCNNPKHNEYRNYGGRGIKVCKEWLDSFENFILDMGYRPSKKHQIDRIDNNKGYSEFNCRWVLPAENSQNKRTTKLNKDKVLYIRRSTHSIQELAKEFNVSTSCIAQARNRTKWVSV